MLPVLKSNLKKATILGVIVGIYLVPSAHAALPQDDRRPGGIAVLPVEPWVEHAQSRGHEVAIVQEGTQKYAVVGIHTKSGGSITVELSGNKKSKTETIALHPFQFKEQHLTVGTSHVNPDGAQLARYAREAKEQNAVYATFSPAISQPATWPRFIKPTTGPYSSPFGVRRFFNGEERNPHSGLDIAAPTGQAALSPADGTIIQTGDYFFNGQTVMIDHGQGIISMLCHLSKIEVAKGQHVTAGQEIGKVGSTGRATGPHLHWSLSLNNTRVDAHDVLPPGQ